MLNKTFLKRPSWHQWHSRGKFSFHGEIQKNFCFSSKLGMEKSLSLGLKSPGLQVRLLKAWARLSSPWLFFQKIDWAFVLAWRVPERWLKSFILIIEPGPLSPTPSPFHLYLKCFLWKQKHRKNGVSCWKRRERSEPREKNGLALKRGGQNQDCQHFFPFSFSALFSWALLDLRRHHYESSKTTKLLMKLADHRP